MVANKALEAAKNGDIDTLQSVKEPSIEADKHGATCLHYAARGGSVKTIEFLVKKKGFDAVKRSDVGATAAHDAAATGNSAALKWILENTECKVDDQDGTGATVLHLATRYGHAPVVSWLLDQTNCDIMKKTSTGAMPLHFAVVGGKLDIVKILVKEAPRSVNLQMNNGVTAVYLAGQSGHLDILQFLVLTANGSLKINSYDAMSVSQAAAQGGHLHCVKWLVGDQKCNPNERDFDGTSALHFAANRGHHEVVDWLMKQGGAKVTLDNLGGSPLHNAAEMGHKKCIEVLLKNGCDTSITDNKGLTAAELAEKCNQPFCAALVRGKVKEEPAPTAPPPLVIPSTSQGITERPAQLASFQGYRTSYNRPPSVHAEVHSCSKKDDDCLSQLSKETGESECIFLPDQRSSECVFLPDQRSSVTSVTHRSPSSLRPTSPPVSPPYSSRNRGSLGSELSSTASTLSSLSASASREFEESDDGQEVKVTVPSPPRVQFASARAQFERGHQSKFDTSRSSGSCEESGESIPGGKSWRYSQVYNSPRNVVLEENATSNNMASPIQTSQNGGVKKTVIQIRGSTVRIDDGTGSRDIKTHSKQNGNVSNPTRSNQPKLIMTMTPSQSEPQVKATNSGMTSVNSSSESASSGQINGNSSPRNSTTVVSSASPRNSAVVPSATVSSNGTSNGGLPTQNGSSSMTDRDTVAKTSSVRPVNVHPPGFSALGDIMKSALPPKVAPQSPPAPSSQQTENVSPPPPPPPPVEEKPKSPISTNVKPSALLASTTQNGYVKPNHFGAPINLIAELQSGPGKSGLKNSKGPNKGTTMVFSFGKGNMGGPTSQPAQPKQSSDSKLDEEFDPKKFLDQVPDADATGQPIPQWKKQMMAKGIAEKARKEAIERRKIEAEEARFQNVPAWKRALIEKKESESKVVEDRQRVTSQPAVRKPPQASVVDEEGRPLTSWQADLRKKKGVIE